MEDNTTNNPAEWKPPVAQKEHLWLQQMLGEWNSVSECSMGPDQPTMKSEATDSVRSLGDLWVIAEGAGEMPGGGMSYSVMTLGFDPAKGKFVGTFVASMMSNLWVYEGTLDESGKVLTLDTEGPTMTGDGKLAKYQDIIELPGDGRRIMRSQMLGADGKWVPFMTANYTRKA